MKKKKKSFFNFEGGWTMIQKVLASIFALASFVGIVLGVEAHYATKEEVILAQADVAEFKLQYAIDRSQGRIRFLEDRIKIKKDRIQYLQDTVDVVLHEQSAVQQRPMGRATKSINSNNIQPRSKTREIDLLSSLQTEIKSNQDELSDLEKQLKEEEKVLEQLYKTKK